MINHLTYPMIWQQHSERQTRGGLCIRFRVSPAALVIITAALLHSSSSIRTKFTAGRGFTPLVSSSSAPIALHYKRLFYRTHATHAADVPARLSFPALINFFAVAAAERRDESLWRTGKLRRSASALASRVYFSTG